MNKLISNFDEALWAKFKIKLDKEGKTIKDGVSSLIQQYVDGKVKI